MFKLIGGLNIVWQHCGSPLLFHFVLWRGLLYAPVLKRKEEGLGEGGEEIFVGFICPVSLPLSYVGFI